MNLDTGEIKNFTNEELDALLTGDERKRWIEIRETMMTERQKANMQVSVYDTKSPLGKVFTSARQRRKAIRKLK